MAIEQQCERCGKPYPAEAAECVHCKDLSDTDLRDIRKMVDEINRRNKGLGLIFAYLVGILLLVVVSLLLF